MTILQVVTLTYYYYYYYPPSTGPVNIRSSVCDIKVYGYVVVSLTAFRNVLYLSVLYCKRTKQWDVHERS